MRVICTCVYRNEADILEAFVRHAAAYCDELILLDHGSTDESPEIARELQREGLPLHLLSDTTLGNVEVDQANRLLQLAAHDFAADWVLSLDADEFIVGAADKSFLASASAGEQTCVKLRSRSYYADPPSSADALNPVERITRRLAVEEPGDLKVIVPGQLVRAHGGLLTQGKHQYFIGTHEADSMILDDVALAHFSLRSAAQYATKLASKHLQKCRYIATQGDELTYYNKPYALLKQSYTAFTESFSSQRLAYMPQSASDELIDDAIAYRGGPLRYTPAGIGPDRFVNEMLELAEVLARSATPPPDEPPAGAATPGRHVAIELTSHPSPGHTDVVNTTADRTRFRTVMLTADCPRDTTELRIELRTDPGLIEISEIVLNHAGPTRGMAFGVDELTKMVRIAYGGTVIAPTDVFRILVSKDPVMLVFSDWRRRRSELPTEVILRIRVEHRLVPAVLLSPAVLNRIAADQLELNESRAQLATALKQLDAYKQHAFRRVYPIGSTINFSADGNSAIFIGEGWSGAEPWGTWTDGYRATLHLRFDAPPKRPLRLSARLFPFLHEKHPAMHLRVVANGAEVAQWTADSTDLVAFNAEIPADKLQEQELEIAFDILNAVVPAELGTSVDARRLGVGMHSVELQWADIASGSSAGAAAAGNDS